MVTPLFVKNTDPGVSPYDESFPCGAETFPKMDGAGFFISSPLIQVSILCVAKKSNYKKISGLDLFDIERDAYSFSGTNPVIVHPPCAQWSKLKGRAYYNKKSKDLANFCFDKVLENGGIFEHPAGSEFFKYRGITPSAEVNQLWFGFPARKATWLYFHNCEPLPLKIFPVIATRQVNNMNSEQRSIMPLSFCLYLIYCLTKTFPRNKL